MSLQFLILNVKLVQLIVSFTLMKVLGIVKYVKKTFFFLKEIA